MAIRRASLAAAAGVLAVACAAPAPAPDLPYFPPPAVAGDTVVTASGLGIVSYREGAGETAGPRSRVTVHFTGWLPDGRVFENTRSAEPVTLQLGQRKLIRAWEEGIPGMRVGERRRLLVPPALGYGSERVGAIPPDTPLVFDVELLRIER